MCNNCASPYGSSRGWDVPPLASVCKTAGGPEVVAQTLASTVLVGGRRSAVDEAAGWCWPLVPDCRKTDEGWLDWWWRSWHWTVPERKENFFFQKFCVNTEEKNIFKFMLHGGIRNTSHPFFPRKIIIKVDRLSWFFPNFPRDASEWVLGCLNITVPFYCI